MYYSPGCEERLRRSLLRIDSHLQPLFDGKPFDHTLEFAHDVIVHCGL